MIFCQLSWLVSRKQTAHGDTGVVHQHGRVPESMLDLRQRGTDLPGSATSSANARASPPLAAIRSAVSPRTVEPQIGHGDPRTLRRQRQRGRPPDSAAGAGHGGDASFDVLHEAPH